jgi:hypothetical protein
MARHGSKGSSLVAVRAFLPSANGSAIEGIRRVLSENRNLGFSNIL